jgi:hypothetical protein
VGPRRGDSTKSQRATAAIHVACSAQGHNKCICGSEWVEHRSHKYIHTYYTTARPVHGVHAACTQLSVDLPIVDLPILELNLLNVHLFFLYFL